MSGKDLFVLIYCSVWASIITIFVFCCALTHCMEMSDAVLISNASFLGVTSLMVFVKPVRQFVDKHIIAKL